MSSLLIATSFIGGAHGPWQVTAMDALAGEPLAPAETVAVIDGGAALSGPAWTLRGVASHLRYTNRDERADLARRQEGLGRPDATCAALIPLRKSPAWWALAQDERRRIIVDSSKHFAVGMRYLPAVARKLYHCRDLGEDFDFITWFEYAPRHASAFDDLLAALRASEEWQYVDREVDVRMVLTIE